MKALKVIVILLILFGLPIGSWYFLKYGFNWRKDKLEKLEVKGHFINDIDWSEEDKTELFSLLAYKTSVISTTPELSEEEMEIIDQYKKAYTFQWVSFVDSSYTMPHRSTRDLRKIFPGLETLDADPLLNRSKYILVDTAMQIRQIYPETQANALGMLIEDIAIVLPRRKEKDISIRNNNK